MLTVLQRFLFCSTTRFVRTISGHLSGDTESMYTIAGFL